MRLIDADKLLPKLWVCYEENKPIVDAEPTVEAIPIEWLKKHSWFNVIDLWRKECQLQDAKDVVCSILKEYNFNSYDEFINYAWKMKAVAKLIPEEERLKIIINNDVKEEDEK